MWQSALIGPGPAHKIGKRSYWLPKPRASSSDYSANRWTITVVESCDSLVRKTFTFISSFSQEYIVRKFEYRRCVKPIGHCASMIILLPQEWTAYDTEFPITSDKQYVLTVTKTKQVILKNRLYIEKCWKVMIHIVMQGHIDKVVHWWKLTSKYVHGHRKLTNNRYFEVM